MLCPRCGRPQPPEADRERFCAHCGQFLIPTTWVASPPDPPPSATPGADGLFAESDPVSGYTGPPRYLGLPAWGFPAQPWRRPDTESADPVSAPQRVALQAGLLIPLLRGVAVLAVLSAAGEIWRYLLLLQSRDEALSAGAVAASDALVFAASWVTTATSVGVGGYLLLWVLRATTAAAERAGVRPARNPRSVLLGWLLPGLNLAVPGSVLAEIEHAALGHPPGQRPRPSRVLRLWWLLWVVNVVLGIVAVIWSLRSGVQAKANGVELHAVVDLVVASVAEVTARVVGWLTALVYPPPVRARQLVVRVSEPARVG